MPVTLRISGQHDEADSRATRSGAPDGRIDRPVTDLFDPTAVQVVASFNLSPSARSQADEPVSFLAQDDDVLEIEVEGGFTTWTSAKRYANSLN